MKAHAKGWDLELITSDSLEFLRVWWLGDHIADCYTVAQVLRVVPLEVLATMITDDQRKHPQQCTGHQTGQSN